MYLSTAIMLGIAAMSGADRWTMPAVQGESAPNKHSGRRTGAAQIKREAKKRKNRRKAK